MKRDHTPEYIAYLKSPRWKKFRQDILKFRAYRCQDCLTLGSSYTLQVHHLHYDTLGHESPDDVLLLCSTCHEKADREREEEVKLQNEDALLEARLAGWARKVYGEYWELMPGYMYVSDKFTEWLRDREEDQEE